MPETYQEFIDRIKREAMADELGGFGLNDLSQTPGEMDRIIGAFPDGMLPLPPGGNPLEVVVPRAGVPPLPLEPTSLSAGRAFPGDFAPPIFASPVEEAAPEGPTGGTYVPVDIPSRMLPGNSRTSLSLARAPRDPEFYADADRRGRRQFRRQLREPLNLARVGEALPGPYSPGHEGHLARAAQWSPGALAAWMASKRKEGEGLAQGPASGMMRRRLDEMQAALDDPDTPRDEKVRLQIRIRKLREEIEIQRGLEERKVGGEEHLNLARGRREMFGSGSRATPHITAGEYNSELDRIRRERGPLAADQYARQTGLTVGGRTGVFTPEALPLGTTGETARGSSVGADGIPVLGETTVRPARLPVYNPTAMNMASAEAADYRAVTNPLTGNTTLVPKEGFEILQPLDETGRPIAGARGEMMPAETAARRREAAREAARLDREKIAAEQAEGGRTFYSPRNISEKDFIAARDEHDPTNNFETEQEVADWANEVLTQGPTHEDWLEFEKFRAGHSERMSTRAMKDRFHQEVGQEKLDQARAGRMGTPRQQQAAMDSQLRRLGMAMTAGFPSGSGVRANVYPGAPGLAGMDPRLAAAWMAAQAQMGVAREQNQPFRMMMQQQMDDRQKAEQEDADQKRIAELMFGGMSEEEAVAHVRGWKPPPKKPRMVRPGPGAGAAIGAVVGDPVSAFSAAKEIAFATAKLATGDFEGAVGAHTAAEWGDIARAIGYDSLDDALGNMAETGGRKPGTPEYNAFIAQLISNMKP